MGFQLYGKKKLINYKIFDVKKRMNFIIEKILVQNLYKTKINFICSKFNKILVN
jgi:hypothetical protein